MAEQPCLAQVQACLIRVAKLDTDGSPLVGASNGYVSDALVSVAVSPQYVDGAEITQDNACGKRIIDYRAPDQLRFLNITIQLATPDPYLAAMLSGGAPIVGAGDELGRIGYAGPELGELPEAPISVEVWAKRPDIDTGGQDADSPWAWWVYPMVKNLRLNDYTHNNGALLPQFSGRAYENPNWADGPWGDWPVASDRALQWFPTDAIPTAQCGPQAIAA